MARPAFRCWSRWMPLVGFVVAQADDVAAVGVHGEQGVDRAVPAATQVASRGSERRRSGRWEEARIEIVGRPVRQLNQVRAVGIDAEMWKLYSPRDRSCPASGKRLGLVGEEDRLLERHFRREERPARQLAGPRPRFTTQLANRRPIADGAERTRNTNARRRARRCAAELITHVNTPRVAA